MNLPKEFIIVTSVVCTLLGLAACSPTLEPVPTNNQISPKPQVYQQQTLVLTNSPTLTKTPTLAKTRIPTKIFTSTRTPIPTGTHTPTITPTQFQLPFVDEFDTGIRPEWLILGDTPYILEKALTTNGMTRMSIGLGDETLTDYIVDFKTNYWGSPNHYIGVRALNEGNMIALKFAGGPEGEFLYLVQNGDWNQIFSSRFKIVATPAHIVINVKGNRIFITYDSPRFNGSTELYLSEPYQKYGGVIFRFESAYPDIDSIDYIRILPNP